MLNLNMLDIDPVTPYDYWQVWRSYDDDQELCVECRSYADALIEIKIRLNEWPYHTGPIEENGLLRWYVDDDIYYELEGCRNAES